MAGNQSAFQKVLNQGHSAAWDQDWHSAAIYYGQAVDEFPENALALSSLGLAYFELQDFERSLECYHHAARVAPTDPVPVEKIARIYEKMGHLKEAAETSIKAAELHLHARATERALDNWKHVLELYPEHLSTRQRLAAVYERLGRYDESVHEYIAVASILQRAGDLTQALKAAEYAVRLKPENQEARFALHTLRSNQLLPRAARPSGSNARSTPAISFDDDPGSSSGGLDAIEEARQKALGQLAELMFEQADEGNDNGRRGVNDLVRGMREQVSEPTGRASITLHLAQAIELHASGKRREAAAELERAQGVGLRSPAAFFLLGDLYAQDDVEKSLRYLREASQNADFALGACLLRARVEQENARLNDAAADYLRALSLAEVATAPDNQADSLLAQYEPLIDAQASEENAAVLKSTCDAIAGQLLRPDWRTFLVAARRTQAEQSPDEPLLPLAEMVLESRGGSVVEAIGRVRALSADGMIHTAMEEAYFAIQLAPTYLPVHVEIAELLAKSGKVEEAVRKFQIISDLYTVRGDSMRSVRLLKRILEISPLNLEMGERMVELLGSQGRVEEALQAAMQLAENYYRLADLDMARQTYVNAVKLAQQSEFNRTWGVEILLKVADIDMQRLNYRQAARIYEQIRTIQPENAQHRIQLFQLLSRLGQAKAALSEVDTFIQLMEGAGQRKKVIAFLEDLVKETPSNLDVRRRLADQLGKAGRRDEAVAQLDAIADAYAAQNKIQEAINAIEMIIQLRPRNVGDYQMALEELRSSQH